MNVLNQSGKWESNPRPSVWETEALPLSYCRNFKKELISNFTLVIQFGIRLRRTTTELLPQNHFLPGNLPPANYPPDDYRESFFRFYLSICEIVSFKKIFRASQLSFNGIIHLFSNSSFVAARLLK